MTDKIQQARHLYMAMGKTQKEIAETVGVSERTIYNWIRSYAWDKLRKASMEAPAMVVENLCSQLVELQNAIASREPGKRYPTPQEAEITRSLVCSIERMKKYPSLAQNMQMMETFRTFVQPKNKDLARQIGNYSENYFDARVRNGYAAYNMEYGMEQVSPITPSYDEGPDDTQTGSPALIPAILPQNTPETIANKAA